LAEADPRGGWATVLMTLPTEIRCENLKLNRRVHLKDIKDAYTTALAHDELVTEVAVKIPPAGQRSGTFQNLVHIRRDEKKSPRRVPHEKRLLFRPTDRSLELEQLLRRYEDAEIGFVDATVVAIAERLKIRRILTTDRRDFSLIQPRHCKQFELLP
jgi:predicted nucleic acid-binding protein